MVSFFGLRFGADKKKTQKQPDKKTPTQQEQEQQQCIPDTLIEIQEPPRRLSRPGTSNSLTGRNINWRTSFSDTPAAASCIDLSSPHRQPSTGSKSLFLGSEVSKPTGRRASFFSIGSKEICFGVSLKVQSPLSQLQFDIQGRENGGRSLEMERDTPEFENGLPSPPQSIEGGGGGGGDELQLTVSASSRSSRHQSMVAGTVNPDPLPSPAPSASQAGEEKREIPVIRNVQAKRDTLTFHSPRRQSFISAVEEANKEKMRQRQNQAAAKMAINTTTAATGSVSNEASSCGSLGMELMQSPVDLAEPHRFPEESREQGEMDTSKHISAEQQRGQQPNPDAELFDRVAPKGFNSRMGSDTRTRGPPQPLRPLSISTNMLSAPATGVPPLDRPLPSPLASKTPMVGDFPVDKGLPRGRLPVRPSVESESSTQQEENGNEKGDGFSSPALNLDGTEPRRSATPAPLFPAKTASSPKPISRTPTLISSNTPTLAMAPVLPNPSFAALEKVTSNGSVEVMNSFEISFDIPQTSPITCDFPALGDGH